MGADRMWVDFWEQTKWEEANLANKNKLGPGALKQEATSFIQTTVGSYAVYAMLK